MQKFDYYLFKASSSIKPEKLALDAFVYLD